MARIKKDDVLRAALYPRVSTEEQVLHGFSLDTQEETLLAYTQEKGYKVVGIYRDEGFSARKPVLKRKVMQELLADVEAGKIDIILFTKLDRWFRSVGEYHKVQNVLDKHHVVWRTILEDYQTETADGRLKVNIMLSVAENEADRTSERIKFVFNGKIKKGEYCYGGQATPFGYKPEMVDGVRRLVKDPETEEAATAFWDKLLKYQSIRRAGREANLEYGLQRTHKSWMYMVRNEVYTGQYKGVYGFCPAYISREAWEAIQRPENRVKSTQGNRVYLFVGLIRCPICGHTMKANYKTYPNDRTKEYYGYRCNDKALGHCTYGRHLSERKVEKYLVENIQSYLEDYALKINVQASHPKKRRKKTDVGKLREQLRRLNNIYIAGNIEDSEYNAQAETLRAAIAAAEQEDVATVQPVNLDTMRQLLGSGFADHYKSFTREEKQRFWRSIIQEIHLDDNKISEIIFKA